MLFTAPFGECDSKQLKGVYFLCLKWVFRFSSSEIILFRACVNCPIFLFLVQQVKNDNYSALDARLSVG